MQRFISDDELTALKERGMRPGATADDALVLAWHLRQRESEHAVVLARRWAARPGLDDGLRGIVHLVTGEHAYLGDDGAAATVAIAQARVAFAAGGCKSGLSDASVLEAAVAGASGDHAGRGRSMRRSIDEAGGDEERRLFGEISLCCLAAFTEPDAALGAYGDAMRAHTGSHWLGAKMMAHTFFNHALINTDRHAERIEHGTLAWRTALAAGALMRAVLEATNVAGTYLDLNDNAAAVEHVQVALEIARRNGWPQALGRCLTLLAEALLRSGRQEGAFEIATEALALLGSARASKTYAAALHVAANVALARGEWADAEHKYQTLTVDHGVSDFHEMARYGHLGLAQTHLAAGRPALAVGPAKKALADATSTSDHALQVEALRALAQAAIRLRAAGTTDPSCGAPLEYLDQASALMQGGGHRRSRLLAEQADAHEQVGDLQSALAAMRQSAEFQREQVVRDDAARAASLEYKLRTERAVAEAAHQTELARVERARASELERLNTQLCSTMEALENASSQLQKRNEALHIANAQIKELSVTDPLTGLHNRRFLAQVIDADVAHCLRAHRDAAAAGSPAAARQHADIVFYLLDLDHFKAVNDEHGHLAGDEVLVQLSHRLVGVTREDDHVVRWGGEEFLVVTRGVDRRRAPVVAEKLRLAIAGLPFELRSGALLTKTCSIGFAAFPLDRAAPEAAGWAAAIDLADHRLYAAKLNGRNRSVGETVTAASAAG